MKETIDLAYPDPRCTDTSGGHLNFPERVHLSELTMQCIRILRESVEESIKWADTKPLYPFMDGITTRHRK